MILKMYAGIRKFELSILVHVLVCDKNSHCFGLVLGAFNKLLMDPPGNGVHTFVGLFSLK